MRSQLGFTLEKTEQCSNWDRRPLSRSQIEYAILDAVAVAELWKAQQGAGPP